MSKLSNVFDGAIKPVLYNKKLEDAWKVRFVVKCLESVTSYGWRDYDETSYTKNEIVKQALDEFLNKT